MSDIPLLTQWDSSSDLANDSGTATFHMSAKPVVLRLDNFADFLAVVRMVEQAYKLGAKNKFYEVQRSIKMLESSL